MSNEQNFLKDKLERLKEELIENIINTTDSEILNEVKEDYGDSFFIANKVREIMKNSQVKVGKSRLKLAKEELQKLDNKSTKTTIDANNAKEKLATFLEENPDFDLLAARSGEEISENDAVGTDKRY
jgi:FKBP-type peptidyl-prolyl cis-trans isomerase